MNHQQSTTYNSISYLYSLCTDISQKVFACIDLLLSMQLQNVAATAKNKNVLILLGNSGRVLEHYPEFSAWAI